jgi:hypothetical protein
MIVTVVLIVLFLVVFSGCLGYVLVQMNKQSSNCKGLKSDPPALVSMTSTDALSTHPLRDFYIKSSYNSCASGSKTNDYVDLCALENAISQGCRFLDFEIYNEDGSPVVAVSDSESYFQKGSYNSLPLDTVLKHVADRAFSSTYCPNSNDVLLLCFRFKTAESAIVNNAASLISEHFSGRLLAKKHSYENNGRNLGQMPLKQLLGKIVIATDKTNPVVDGSDLKEYINIGVKTPFFRLLTYNDVANTPDKDELVTFNEQNMTISIANKGETANYDSVIMRNFGVQISAMSMQIKDPNLEAYNTFFSSKAFVLREENFLYKPVAMPTPPPLNKADGFVETARSGSNYEFVL